MDKEFYLNHWYADIYEQHYKPQEDRPDEQELILIPYKRIDKKEKM